ncbi:MAG TPA: glycine--tRNA ligase subunit beta [Steroidobacteraceae bacterium]|jgi:glycyl-tRNA synthetase beta chain|nr:glycine--tRNA ligase subunit beta [Steroidobacteraceae bacterium]
MSDARDFLIEIGTEELPPKALSTLSEAFVAGIAAGLEKARLAHGQVAGFATPRRLAVRVLRLAAQQPEQHVRRRGPPVSAAFDGAGAPTRAALAFAASCGTTVEALERIEEGKGTFLYFAGTRAGERTVQLLPALVQAALDQLPIPRRMHWGEGEAMFVRPVHWIVMLFGRDVVPATLLETETGRRTHGHRFHAPRPLSLASPAAYERTLLEKGHVLADFAARRARIRTEVATVASAVEGRALVSEALLDEVTALTEWPVALAGRFEERFLALPREVLICTLEEHQRYFPVEDAHGQLLPAFITVSNIASRDPLKVREGNERVVRARLSDAAFFWEQDRREPLAARRGALETVTFQGKLGSLGDKTRRVRALIGDTVAAAGASLEAALRAADLAKCDLLTAMVGEFPELQGIMGAYYAQADGEPEEVALSLREQYLPRSAGDALPASGTGLALAIADKLDTIAGIFAIGEKPSGTKDPFALRRAALGVQRILIEKGLDLDLRACIGRAVEGVRTDIARLRTAGPGAAVAAAASPSSKAGGAGTATAPTAEALVSEIYDFLMERLRAYYLEGAGAAPVPGRAAVTTEMFDAVLATRPASSVDFDARLKALSTFLDLPEAASLTAANKRISNILRRANTTPPPEVDVMQLREEAEMRLYDAMRGLRDAVSTDTGQRLYTDALGRLALLRPAVDTFFDKVLVMDENPQLRANRLSLLTQLQGLFGGIADLSRLPG